MYMARVINPFESLWTQFKQDGWAGVTHAWRNLIREKKLARLRQVPLKRVVILTVPNTLYIAGLIQNTLKQKGIQSTVITKRPLLGYQRCLHFVIAPQAFKSFPKTFVAFQMEQYVSGALSKPKSINKLQKAVLVMDYSLSNIQFQINNGFPTERLFHVPVAQLLAHDFSMPQRYEYDVAFYGDTNNERRQKYLKALSEKFKLLIIDNAFGQDAFDQLRQAKLVVNIHYYEGALLETTRLFECISNGVLVVSETACDMPEHIALNGLVDFVPVGDVAMMVERVNYWLTHENERIERLHQQYQFASETQTPFTQQFDRVLRTIGID